MSQRYLFGRPAGSWAIVPTLCGALALGLAGKGSAQAVGGWFHPPVASSGTASSYPITSYPQRQIGNAPVRQTEPMRSDLRYRYPVGMPENAPPMRFEPASPVPTNQSYSNGYSNDEPGVVHSYGGAYSTVVPRRVIEPEPPQGEELPEGRIINPVHLTLPQPPNEPIRPNPGFDTTYDGNYIYSPIGGVPVGPPLLGGYYYGNYCETPYSSNTYPSVYSLYDNFPQYVYSAGPSVVVLSQPYYPDYATWYQPFSPPAYQVTYNQNNYYVASEDRVKQLDDGGDQAQAALVNAYPDDSYQAAFADIEKSWTDRDLTLIKKHLRNSDTKISVFLDKKYSYSIAAGDYSQITRDAFDHLNTVSFAFTSIRKAKNGDVTAYGSHVYQSGDTSDQSDDGAAGVEKTAYVSYTLRHHDGLWYIIAIDSSKDDLAPQGS